MEFSYRISPFIYTKYMFYTFRWLLLLLPAAMCPTFPPREGISLGVSLLSYYIVLLLSFCGVIFLLSSAFSLFFTLWQHQAGVTSTVRVDDSGLTEVWGDRQIHIPWTSVRQVTTRKRFLQVRSRSPHIHWFLFRSAVGKETFRQLSSYIRSHTAAR